MQIQGLTSDDNLRFEIRLLNPFDRLLELLEATLIRHITGMYEDISLGKLEGSVGRRVVSIGNANETRLAHGWFFVRHGYGCASALFLCRRFGIIFEKEMTGK